MGIAGGIDDGAGINVEKVKAKAEEIDISNYIGLEHLDSGSLHVSRWGSVVPIKGDKIVMHTGDCLESETLI